MSFGKKAIQRRVSEVRSVLAPVGGIDDLNPLAAMGEEYCIQLNNWVPVNSSLDARQGYREWATNLGLPVRTLMQYNNMSGDSTLFAATDAGIYDVTLSTDTPILSRAVTNGNFNHLTFGNVAFQYLIALNKGSDPGLLFDGTNWIEFVQSATPTAPGQINGVDPSVFTHVAVFKRRLWFVEIDSMTAWYLPIDATSGQAKPFYFTSIFKRGGKLLYIVDWTVDGGDGLDNKLVFVSSLGEVAVYSGTDPDVTTAWRLDAVFFAGAPIGEKSFTEFGGDVFMTTSYGVIPLTKVLMGVLSTSPNEQAVSKRINKTLNRIVLSNNYVPNWELYNIPVLQAITVLIPPLGDKPAIQFVMNSITGAWTRFDLPANCGIVRAGDFYFGTVDGRVCRYGGGIYVDNLLLNGTGGDPVECSLFSAYNYMGDPTTIKHWKLIRPVFQSDQPPSYLVKLNTDFETAALVGTPLPPAEAQTNPLWDLAIWDDAFWSSTYTVFRPWLGVSAIGFCCALLLKSSTNDRVSLVAIEFVYESGGAI